MDSTNDARHQSYWRANLRLVSLLLSIWFLVGYVLSIVFVEALNEIHIAGFPLGFWFAQQGSMWVFIVLIYVYARRMEKIDKKFDVQEGSDS